MALFMDVHHIDGGVTVDEVATADDAQAVHRDAHGLMADAIYQVVEG
jgi:hypothetical protein